MQKRTLSQMYGNKIASGGNVKKRTLAEMYGNNTGGLNVSTKPTGTQTVKKEEPKDNGGFFGGLGYLGEKLAVGLVSSLEGAVDYVGSGFAKLIGNDKWAEEIISEDWFGDWYSHPEQWFNPSDGWKVAGDVAGGIGTSIPSIAMAVGLTALTGGLAAPAAVKIAITGVGSGLASGLGAAGRSTKEAYEETGVLSEKEFGYGALSGLTEGSLEGITNVLSLGGGAVVKSISKAFGKEIGEAAVKEGVIKTLGKSFIGEAFEESMSEFLDPFWKQATYDADAEGASLDQILYSGLVGGLSGMVMGGGGMVTSGTVSVVKGNKLAESGGYAEVLDTSNNLIQKLKRDGIDDEVFREISETREKLVTSMLQTDNKIVNLQQKKMLGELATANVRATGNMFVAKRALNIVNNAEVIAERMSAFGYKDANGRAMSFTAEELTAGYDPKKPSSIYKALRDNSVLRTVAVADAAGALMIDTRKFTEATLTGKKLASQVDINRFVKSATAEEIKAVSDALKIDDWRTLTRDTLAERITEYLNEGGLQRNMQEKELRAEFEAATPLEGYTIPKTFLFKKDGVRRFSDGSGDIGISKSGDVYRIFDYDTGAMTKEMTRAEVNTVLRDYDGKRFAAFESERRRLAEIEAMQKENAEIEEFVRTNVKDYAKLSAPAQSQIERIVREGRAKGVSDSDVLMYAKVAAHSGIDFAFDKESNAIRNSKLEIRNDTSSTVKDGPPSPQGEGLRYADGYYDASRNLVVINPEATRTHERLLIHELDHAIRKSLGKNGATRVYFEAIKNVDQATRDKIAEAYKKTAKPGEAAATIMDETNAYYAEQVLGNKYTLEKLVEAEPTLKEKILSFFKGASEDYADVPKLSNAAKKYYKTYKKLFDEFSARNAENNASENAHLSTLFENNSQKMSITSMKQENMSVSDRQYAAKLLDSISDDEQNKGNEIADFIDGVNSMLDESKKNKRKKKIGLLSDSHVKVVNDLIRNIYPDFSAEGYELWIDGIGAQHIEQRHGKNGEADSTMASREEKALIPWAAQNAETGDFIREPDGSVRHSRRFFNSDGSRAPEIRLEKKTSEGLVFISECVPDSLNKRIWITSAYRNKNGSKGQLLNIEDSSSPQPTPEASFDSNATSNSIPENQKNVKGIDENSSDKQFALPIDEEGGGSEAGASEVSKEAEKGKGLKVASELKALKEEVRGLKVDPKGVMAISDRYFDRYDGKMSRSAMRMEFLEVAKVMASDDKNALELGYERALKIADELLSNEKESGGYAAQIKDIKAHVKGIKLKIHEQDKADFDGYGGYGEFRKQNFGRVKLGNSGVEVDSVYGELQNLYGYDIFPEVNSIAEMVNVMANIGESSVSFKEPADSYVKEVQATSGSIYTEIGEVISKGLPNEEKPRLTRADVEKYLKKLDAEAEVKLAKAKARIEKRAESRADETIKQAEAKMEARYKTDTEFSQQKMVSIFNSSEFLKKMNRTEKARLIKDFWYDLSRSNSDSEREYLALKFRVKLRDAMEHDANSEFARSQGVQREAFENELDRVSKEILKAGRKSFRAKLADDVRGEVKEQEEFTRNVLTNIYQATQKISDEKTHRYAAASDYKGNVFRGSIESLSKIDWRGKFSAKVARKEFAKLREWYNKENPMFKDQQLGDISISWFDTGIADRLDFINSSDKDSFTNAELEAAAEVLSYFANVILNYDKAYIEGRWQDAEPIARKMREAIVKQDKTFVPPAVRMLRNDVLSGGARTFADPESIMKLADGYDDGILTTYYNELVNAEVNAQSKALDIKAEYDDFMKSNPKFLKGEMKNTVKIGNAEVARIDLVEYAMLLRREGAWMSIAEGGVVFTDVKKKNDVRVYPIESILAKIPSDVKGREAIYEEMLKKEIKRVQEQVNSMLTKSENKYIEILEKGYEAAREVKAEGDMKLRGVISVVEGYYYPMRHADSEHLSDFDVAGSNVDKFSNASFNKHVVDGAKSALRVRSADSTFNAHVKAVTGYANVSPVVDSFNKVFKLKFVKGEAMTKNTIIEAGREDFTSVQRTMNESKSAWRDKNGKLVGIDYLQNLIQDTMGKRGNVGDGFWGTLRGNAVTFSLGLNPKVLITQTSSLLASTAILQKRSLVKSAFIWNGGMDKYSQVARIRNSDYTVAKAAGVINEISRRTQIFTAGITLFDRLVVYRAWAACQAEVAAKGGPKIGTEENRIKAGQLLDQTILKTQQSTFATQKTEGARRGGDIVKSMLMFKSDSIKLAGRVIDGWGEWAYTKAILKNATEDERATLEKKLKEAKKKTLKAVNAVTMNAVFAVAIAEMFRKFHGKDKDESEEEKAHRLGLEFVGNLLSGSAVFSEIYSWMTSDYGLDSMEYSAINGVIDTSKAAISYAGKVISGTADERERNKLIENTLYSLGQLTGVPFRNVKNTSRGVINWFDKELVYKWDDALYKQNYSKDLNEALSKGDDERAMMIMELALGEKLGSGFSDKSIKELARLFGKGESVLPTAISDTLTVNGEEIVLSGEALSAVRSEYSKVVDVVNGFVDSGYYKALTVEQKAKAIRKLYSSYKNIAYDAVLGTDKSGNAGLVSRVVSEDAFNSYLTLSVLESDVDKNGKTIAGSKRAKVVKAIGELGVSPEERLLLICASGYTLKDGDIRGLSAERAKTRLLKYILSLKGVSAAEKAEIAEMCGFEVKNGRIVRNSAGLPKLTAK